MIKKLDLLVIKAFVGPFIATFFITLLVLVMQFFWLYIDDFVGKGLGIGLILEFIGYQSTSLVPLALPLAVLLSSLMTFGNLGESYELVAIKSAGISLLRFMRPLFFVSILISGLAFLFSNYIIPVSNLKSRTMLTDIVYAKPAFDLKEGVFYDKIPGFSIKIGKKEENDSVIRDIIIYEQKDYLQDNFIVASDGIMRIADNKRDLEFHLKNGWRYEERGNPGTPTEFIRLGFKEYRKSFDLSSFGLQQRTADSVNKNNARMLSMRQLNTAIDSIKKVNAKIGERVKNDVFSIVSMTAHIDSNWKSTHTPVTKKSFDAFIPDSVRTIVQQRAQAKIESMRNATETELLTYKEQSRTLRLYKIEWHKKLTLSLACVVLFLIGAPLGSIIRKGGLGTPLVFAIGFFMVFYFSSTSGEKFAKEGSWGMVTGMWFSFLILIPVGVFLTYKAMHDSQVFNKDFYSRLAKKLPFRKRKNV
ncbi:LptF/LptG family permease [Flavisolibacter nicotianae]|uniref:LptF/LptG family permease n=1 Tax=Flavisolibacter nicotianae TaxID=2364882 RepID=UPI001F0889AF|nr:LptF/LptG family permease [Flavisolibacter nicotianae]